MSDDESYGEIENGQIRISALGADVVVELGSVGGVAVLTLEIDQARALADALLTVCEHIDADAEDVGAELLGGTE